MNFFIGIRSALIIYAVIGGLIYLCTGCVCLPTRYSVKVPIYVTQDAMHRLPYNNTNRMGSEGNDE